MPMQINCTPSVGLARKLENKGHPPAKHTRTYAAQSGQVGATGSLGSQTTKPHEMWE